MTYRDLFKVMEKFGLLDFEADNFQADAYPHHNDNYVSVIWDECEEGSKSMQIKLSTGEILLEESGIDPESELGDLMTVSSKEMSLKDIKDWG